MGKEDDGLTLVETLITMVVVGVIAAVTTAAVVNVTRLTRVSAEISENAFDARHSTRIFSRDVRNIYQVTEPALHNGKWYSEYCVYGAASDTEPGVSVGECVQWRLTPSEGNLEMRRVATHNGTCLPGADPHSWTTIARRVVNDANTPPLKWVSTDFDNGGYNAELTVLVRRDTASTESRSTFGLPNMEGDPRPSILALCSALERT